ncbi:hypothetical protein FA10DRAFT_286010 [Acaromyces ingoldii]|uniref:AN1-type domain-containing protein n=1 Tax=Acaromyces ingoldii TaxID=215250 RepID=A0A316YNR0_9BASI|nr:hypothetical protein FA10DRAFT_286010 [Acaromyces ingoldii]PWN90298.1 hypothetical protein FA10DRAFT_286010 [Acaromyces ingoldii]
MSGSSTPPRRVTAAERHYNSEMMFIGQRCHWQECNREDFLPFRCPDCQETFCSEHFKTGEHQCPTPSQSFMVPLCPLCHEPPRNWKRDEDANVAMDAHLTPDRKTGKVECAALNADGSIANKGKRAKREGECSERRCHKVMVVPINCPCCSLSFCPSHRAPNQHSCTSLARSSSSNLPPSSRSRLVNIVPSPWSNDQPSKSSEGQLSSALNRSTAGSSASPIRVISTATSNYKTEKRATSEHASALKALKSRQAKGLLTPAEEVRLAEEMALEQKGQLGKKNGDCIVC